MQRRLSLKDQSTLLVFCCVWKETIHKPPKVATVKNFPSEYVIGEDFFDKCFLFRVITGRYYFLKNVYRYPEVLLNHHAVAFFEISVLNVGKSQKERLYKM